jgi:diguanylate cyclase (GGDEF)-like protein
VWNVLINRGNGKEEFRYRHAAGYYIWQETVGNILLSDTGDIMGAVFASRDITERKQAEEIIQYHAYHDGLTGLPNRMLYSDRLNVAISQAERNKLKLVVMMLDLDKFKNVNDTLGHQMGDRLLQDIARRLVLLLRKSDTIARIGGDEFVVLLTKVSNAIEDSNSIAQKIVDTFQEPFPLAGHKISITTSIGIALYPDDGKDLETLIKNADKALYYAKDQGRNTYRRYHPKIEEAS